MFVCLGVREYTSGSSPFFSAFYLHVGSVVLWQCYDMVRTSGFMNDVIFAHNGPGRYVDTDALSETNCVVVRSLTPLLRRIGHVVCLTTADAKTRLDAQGVSGRRLQRTTALLRHSSVKRLGNHVEMQIGRLFSFYKLPGPYLRGIRVQPPPPKC